MKIETKAMAIIQNFKEFFESTSAKKAVVGISGGVDSACTTKIVVEALGAENVFGLIMPHKDFSSNENKQDAIELAENLGIDYREVEISKYTNSFFTEFEFCKSDFARANLMSRTRMLLLYAAANSMNGIVLGTSNKTEIMIGFFTKYGDGGIDIEVIGELWKTEIFELARYFGLDKFADKKPTAELSVNHFDEEEIGVQYDTIDAVLKKIENNPDFKPQNIEEEKVYSLYINNEHKRQMPPVIKATN